MGDGAIAVQGASLRSDRSSASTGVSPCQGRRSDAFLPAWPSWIPRHCSFTREKTGHRSQMINLRVAPETQVTMCASAVLLDGSGLDKNKPGSSQREAAKMNKVPVIRLPVLGPILAHGRDGDAVLERDITQLEGREENRHCDGTLLDGLSSDSSHNSKAVRAKEVPDRPPQRRSLRRFLSGAHFAGEGIQHHLPAVHGGDQVDHRVASLSASRL